MCISAIKNRIYEEPCVTTISVLALIALVVCAIFAYQNWYSGNFDMNADINYSIGIGVSFLILLMGIFALCAPKKPERMQLHPSKKKFLADQQMHNATRRFITEKTDLHILTDEEQRAKFQGLPV